MHSAFRSVKKTLAWGEVSLTYIVASYQRVSVEFSFLGGMLGKRMFEGERRSSPKPSAKLLTDNFIRAHLGQFV